ncbi:MAG: 16S rRNA processing protein RimM [Rhodospirillales bacterium]|nr:16S rRNA processing protein RimM [Alphaproteobacteria bacterium]MBL6947141.1 16S rRNA processing protein RimM [Rhodospirillales bacterium]
MATSSEDRVCVGAIAGARGLKGEVRIKSFTGDPDDISAYGPVWTEDESRSFKVTVKSRAKGLLIARLDGVNDRTEADALKGTRLYVSRDALPAPEDGVFYHADLVGLTAETETGEALGTVQAIHNFGAGDILEIVGGEENEDMMVPFTEAMVPEVDLEGGCVVIVPPTYIEPDGPEDGPEDDDEDDNRNGKS